MSNGGPYKGLKISSGAIDMAIFILSFVLFALILSALILS